MNNEKQTGITFVKSTGSKELYSKESLARNTDAVGNFHADAVGGNLIPATRPEDVLMAFVMVDDKVCIVRADEVGKALVALHGTPTHGLKVAARMEYALRSAADVAELEEFDRLGLDH